MRLRREAGLGVGVFVTLMVTVVVGCIVLLGRMGPAIGRILEENVASEEAVEEMLAVLAVRGGDDDARFAEALERARKNVTEPEEPALLEELHQVAPSALQGDASARRQAVQALRRLGAVNRASMMRSDVAARRLGLAGAWAVAFLGAVGFGVGVLIDRRIRIRLALPIDQVRLTLERARGDDMQARCRAIPQAPVEVAQIAGHVNWLLDRLQLLQVASRTAQAPAASAEHQRALLEAIDLDPRPRLLIDEAGRALAKNRAALEADAPVVDGVAPDGWETTPVAGSSLRWLVKASTG